jgi:hypothetical protein
MKKDLEVSDSLHHSEVTERYRDSDGYHVCVMKMREKADKDHLIREMAQLGWEYDYTSLVSGELHFKSNGTIGA